MDLSFPQQHNSPQRPRPSSSSGHMDSHHLALGHDNDNDNEASRVTTPSSPGSTSGESLSAIGDDSDVMNNDAPPRASSRPSTSASAVLQGSSSGAGSASSSGVGVHLHHSHASTSASNSHHGGAASASSGGHTATLSSRRRHHHHQHSLTLGTGSAKMGSSITDSAQSTEDEMYDDDKEEPDTEDDRPRILYPALATPKAAGNNFWPFGTTDETDDNDEQQLPDAIGSPHQHGRSNAAHTQSSSSHISSSNAQAGPSSSSLAPLTRKQSITSHSDQNGSTSLAAYRSQIQAPSGANAAFLPHEILLKILRNVRQTEDLVSALQVCKSWCQCGVELLWNKPLFPHVGPLIKMLVILSRPQSTFPYASFIKRLNFSQLADKMSDALLARLHVCSRLERLTLAGCAEITDSAMTTLLASTKNLVALDLSDCVKITDETVLMAAKVCKRLQGLNLSGCVNVTDEGVKAIANGCPLLRRVKLRNLSTLSDDAIIALALLCPLLLEVDLYACSSVTDRTLWALFRNSSHLRELSLNNCTQVTGDGFPQRDGKLLYVKGADDPSLKGLKPLNPKLSLITTKSQDTSSSVLSSANLDPSKCTILNMRIFDHVRYLDLTGMMNLTDTAMAGIVATMPHIRNLVLAKCSNLTDESVQSICKLGKHIHFLHLGHVSNITDKAVTTLARACTRLRYIDLACCPNLTDLSVFELAANLPRLKRIGLVRVSNLTDQAIFALAERTTLERIHLSYCEHVSVAAIQFLLSRLSRLNHLSLTGVPAFRRADLQHFCRPPPKDFNPHQRSTFCVYSGKGVHELRKHLMALQQHELAGGMNGANSLIPPASAFHSQTHQHPNQTFHHHQFAQMQLGNNGQQNQQLPTYPHLFQHPAGHAVISQMPLQASQDDGEDVDEDVDEEDDDNGDDEADEDRATPEGQSSASRRHHHSQHQYRQASSSNAQSSHSHNHRHHSHQQQRSYISSQQANGQSNLSAQASTFAPVPYYRGNHRMTGQTDLIGGSNSPSSETAGVGTSTSAPQAAGGPMYSLNFYSTELQPPVTHGQIQQHYQQNLSPVPSDASAWLGQITGNEPLTQIRVPPASSGAGPSRSSVPGQQSGSSSTGWRPFTPVRSPHTSRPTSSYTAAQPAQQASTHESNGSSEMDLMDMRASPEVRQRSYSVDMDLNTEDEPQVGTDSVDDGLSRTLRPRRDTIMQSTYRQESA